MLTVIFNKDLDNELIYTFSTYSENYSKLDGWMLRFGASEELLATVNGNLADYVIDLLNPEYHVETIHVYNHLNKLIDYFDDYSIISECLTFYEESFQRQQGELRFTK